MQYLIICRKFATPIIRVFHNLKNNANIEKESCRKLSDSVWTNSPKLRNWSVAKYCPFKIAKLSCREFIPTVLGRNKTKLVCKMLLGLLSENRNSRLIILGKMVNELCAILTTEETRPEE